MAYHAPKPSQVHCINHAHCQFKEHDLDINEHDSNKVIT